MPVTKNARVDTPAETFRLTLDYIGQLRKSPYTQRWERFVRAHEDDRVFVFGAEGKAAATVAKMSAGDSLTVTAQVGKTVDREANGQVEQQTRLFKVFVA